MGGVGAAAAAITPIPLAANGSGISDGTLRKAALIVDISDYEHGPNLKTPGADARLIGGLLARLGFRVHQVTNPDRDALLYGLARFRELAQSANLVAIHIASHGTIVGSSGMIFPSDTPFDRPAMTLRYGVTEDVILRAVSDRPRQRLLFFDACRAPLDQKDAGMMRRDTGTQLAPAGVFALYSAQPGAVAYDGAGAYSPFAAGLALSLATPNLQAAEVARMTRLHVLRATGGRQIVWSRSSLLSPIILNRTSA